MTAPHVRALAEVAPLAVFGVEVRVLLPAAVAGGVLSMFEDRQEPGGGPPLHVHHDAAEIFHVLEGAYRFRCGDETVEAGPGHTVMVPPGTPHTFLNVGTGTGRLLVTMQPGGFEGFFEAVAAERLAPPADMARIVEIARAFHLEFLGPNPLGASGAHS